jgi:hypothetical protein
VDAPCGAHMVGLAKQIHPRCPNQANVDAANAQRVALALEVQAAAATADNEPKPFDCDAN